MDRMEEMATVMAFGELFSDDPSIKGRAIATLLLGQMDEGLIAFHTRMGNPESVVRENLESLKDTFRRDLQGWLDGEEFRLSKERKADAARAFTKQHEQSAHGTTAELAEKLNISMKKVRKLRAEGKLDEAIAAL